MKRTAWGAVVVGAAAGLGLTAAFALGLFLIGLDAEGTAASGALIFVQFFGQFTAGVVGGRFAAGLEAYHGSQAALLLFAVTAGLTLAVGGAPGLPTLLLSGALALGIGAAGGVLAASLGR